MYLDFSLKAHEQTRMKRKRSFENFHIAGSIKELLLLLCLQHYVFLH